MQILTVNTAKLSGVPALEPAEGTHSTSAPNYLLERGKDNRR